MIILFLLCKYGVLIESVSIIFNTAVSDLMVMFSSFDDYTLFYPLDVVVCFR